MIVAVQRRDITADVVLPDSQVRDADQKEILAGDIDAELTIPAQSVLIRHGNVEQIVTNRQLLFDREAPVFTHADGFIVDREREVGIEVGAVDTDARTGNRNRLLGKLGLTMNRVRGLLHHAGDPLVVLAHATSFDHLERTRHRFVPASRRIVYPQHITQL